MTTNKDLKHAADTFDNMTDDFLMHYGTPGMHWRQQGPGKRWQSQAVYAQGRPNPDANVRGNKVDTDTKKRMSTMNDLDFILSDRSNIPVYPKQKLSDLKRLNKPVDKSVRYEINHPSFEKDADGYPNYDGRHCNCPNCAMAFEMTERGYDVIARPAEDGSNVGDIERFFQNKQLQSMGPTAGDLKKASKLYEEYSNADKKYFDAYHAWKSGNIFSRPRLEKEKDAARRERDKVYDKYFDEADSIVNKVVDNTNKAILSQGPSARGIIVVGWADSDDITGPFRTTAYHAFNYKNENGKVKFYDVQSGRGNNLTGFTIDEAKDGFFQDVDPRDVFIMRTDNAKVTERTMDAIYSPNRSKELKHVANVFDQMTDTYLQHDGVPGMEWYKNKAERYQPQAQYARFIPNPNAKVRGQKRGLNDKPMDVNTINKQIASGELKSVGATNAKRWETSVKNAYKAAKNKPEDKLTKPVDRVFNEVSRLQKQASANVDKEIRSQGTYSVGTLVVGNLFDRFSPERKTTSSYRSYTYRYADGKVKFYEDGTDKEVTNERVFDDIDPRSVYIKKKRN